MWPTPASPSPPTPAGSHSDAAPLPAPSITVTNAFPVLHICFAFSVILMCHSFVNFYYKVMLLTFVYFSRFPFEDFERPLSIAFAPAWAHLTPLCAPFQRTCATTGKRPSSLRGRLPFPALWGRRRPPAPIPTYAPPTRPGEASAASPLPSPLLVTPTPHRLLGANAHLR